MAEMVLVEMDMAFRNHQKGERTRLELDEAMSLSEASVCHIVEASDERDDDETILAKPTPTDPKPVVHLDVPEDVGEIKAESNVSGFDADLAPDDDDEDVDEPEPDVRMWNGPRGH